MQYQVPQFIDVEDKIFGPFTFKQFIYIIGGLMMAYLIYRLIPTLILSAIPIIVVLALAGALAFYKVNNRPFINVLESAFRYSVGSKLYLWKKDDKKQAALIAAQMKAAESDDDVEMPSKKKGSDQSALKFAGLTVPKVSQSKLKDLAWNLDIQERINSGETAAN
ncbi:MAG: PrgI family protein [Candidatus Pacebacteria bacterium]|nr:PrgI family protein [Candidatus Paceibacterota bacterium]